ncbi:MAG: CPBP family intramembrane glutamic endopeptidase [Bacteroidota bacterium]
MNEIELWAFDHILLFLLGVVLPLFAVFQSQPDMEGVTFDTTMKKQIYYGNGLFQWICVGLIVLLWWTSDRNFGDLGLQLGKWSTLGFTLLGLTVGLYLLDVFSEFRNREKLAEAKKDWLEKVPILPTTEEEFRHFLFVAFTAGVCEEIIFRGFFVQYFLAINENNLMGNVLSVLIPAFLFACGHLYQGHKAVAKTMTMAILFGWIFILTESLLLLMLVHFLVDVFSGYLAFRLLRT